MFTHRFRYAFILLLTAYSFLNIQFTVGDRLFVDEIKPYQLFASILLTILFLWEGNRLAERLAHRLSFFRRNKIHHLISMFIISLAVVLLSCSLVLVTADQIFDLPGSVDFSHEKLLLVFGFRVNLFLQCVNAIVFFMNRLKRTEIKAEKLRKITIEAQFEALRTQVNPHFMFNCFNVLSSLVYKDADMSARFIGQLSNVYRYLLQSQQKKVVTLREELDFIDSYLFLLKIRFGENLIIEKDISTKPDKFYVAPASLQMLIENAIKHNVISKNNPLRVRLYSHNGSIVVVNNLQKKQVSEESTRIGLNNIISRYLLLSDEKVVVEKNEQEFKVAIPLLQFDET